MSLPTEAIDRIFRTLSATYGAEFDRMYANASIADAKSVWLDLLDAFDGPRMAYIAWALKNLPERCPNAIEFRNLCRKAPELEVPRLPEPPADPERIRAELERMKPLRMAPVSEGGYDPKAWARRIVARVKDGDKTVRPIAKRFACEALGISVESVSEIPQSRAA